jgi:hypothetical protein
MLERDTSKPIVPDRQKLWSRHPEQFRRIALSETAAVDNFVEFLSENCLGSQFRSVREGEIEKDIIGPAALSD